MAGYRTDLTMIPKSWEHIGQPSTYTPGFGEKPQRVAPGVLAIIRETDRGLYMPFICGDPEGAGHVGLYLDSLTCRVVVPNVLSDVLAGMLKRRGFRQMIEYSPEFREWVECWVRKAEEER